MHFQLSTDWLHAIRLFLTFGVTVALGAHAFHRSRRLAGIASPKLWAFFLYALAFILASTLNFVSLLVTIATRAYSRMPAVSLGHFTVLLVITYAAFAIAMRPTRAR